MFRCESVTTPPWTIRGDDRGDGTGEEPRGLRFVLLVAVLPVSTFLTAFDGQVITVALPAISADLGLEPSDAQWVLTAYVLTFGGFLLVGGRLGDRFGRRSVLLVGLAAFGAGLVVAGLAGHLAVLLAGRVVQGIGAALMWPTTFALISALPSARRRRWVLAAASCAAAAPPSSARPSAAW